MGDAPHRAGYVGQGAAVVALTGALLWALVGLPVLAGPVVDVAVDEQARAADDLDLPTTPVDLGVVGSDVTFTAEPGAVLQLADGRRFLDTLELSLVGDDQRLVNEVGIDDYVAGVSEMPGRWHQEALKAQAVAARTYAWHLIELGTFGSRGFDICDTVDCQVFAGASQEEGVSGERWRAAVDATAGQVLVDDGSPILARYFSTSGGRTLPNEVVFPSSGARPYLVGTDDPADAISPFHRWEVTFSRAEFDVITGAGSTLARVTPVAEVERLGPVDVPDVDLRFVGADGSEATLGSVELRRFVSEVAPSRFPDRFPTVRADGRGPLPTTMPSGRFEIAVADDEIVVRGRGWGHAVGMGQYGALGRAQDGQTYDEILAAYYAGRLPATDAGLPERVRVGLSDSAVGSVRGERPVTIVADAEVVTDAAAGTWELSRDGGGVRLAAPAGWGEPATVSRTTPAASLPSGTSAVPVEAVTATPGHARLRVTDPSGVDVLDRSLGAVESGVVTTRWDLRDAEGDTVTPGAYAVAVEVVAADGSRDGAALTATVDPAPSGTDRLTEVAGGGSWGTMAALLLAASLVALAVAARRRRGVDGQPSAREARSERAASERAASERAASERAAEEEP